MIPRNILIHKIFSLPFCKKEEKHKKILTNVRVGAIMSSVKAMTERVHWYGGVREQAVGASLSQDLWKTTPEPWGENAPPSSRVKRYNLLGFE